MHINQGSRAPALRRGDMVPQKVRDLLRPEARGADAAAPATLRMTHASWVVLGSNDVWKLKRPVNLGFLDFRTIAARRHACEEEVRLNRRLAPDVYLGVEPVRRTSRGHALVGDGPIVDWAVRMRRLPDAASAAAMLERGALTPDLLRDLAERLASFLAAARTTPAFGTLEAMRMNVDENFTQVASMVGEFVDPATYDDARRFQVDALTEDALRFEARVVGGHIREGHGDLRLEHIYFSPTSRVTVIDCIEFNERFRCGDVAGEVAFLAMELEAAGRPDLADGFVARFAEASQDFDLFGVLDFYLSYRAFVRGKVAAFVASDPSTPFDVRRAKGEEARSRFAQSRAAAGHVVIPPFIVAVGGIVGSGKSTLARALGRSLAVPVVSSDRARKSMAGLDPTARGDAKMYEPDRVEKVYGEIMRRAAVVVGAGRSVIVDATFGEGHWRAAAADLARQTNAGFVFVEASCPDEGCLRERLAARRAHPSESDATDAELDLLTRKYQPRTGDEPHLWLTVNTSGPAKVAEAAALRALATAGISARFSHPG